MNTKKSTVGVIGAGTMGSGIALAALYASMPVVLQDVFPQSFEKARVYLEKFLLKKGWSDRIKLVTFTATLDDFRDADIVIEAALEKLSLKKEIFSKLEEICPVGTILATNTSTLSVTAIASAVGTPHRVVGMHFFNPAPLLPLVEVVRGTHTDDQTIKKTVEFAEALGKTPVVTKDTPGFIVNRVARPFYGEALRLLGEGAADHETIDRVIQGAGFRMGPFRLMDLIGVDINATAMQSMYEQTFGEPRYRPHPIQMEKMNAGLLGRKSGRGFYEYGQNQVSKKESPPVKKFNPPSPILVFGGDREVGLVPYLKGKGCYVQPNYGNEAPPIAAFINPSLREGLRGALEDLNTFLPTRIPIFVNTAAITLTEAATWVDGPERLIGFDGLFFRDSSVASLIPSPVLEDQPRTRAELVVRNLGKTPVWIPDSPGMILPRILSMLANEAVFAVLDGVADEETVDLAMRLGVNYPKGPIVWARELGYNNILDVLDHLYNEYHEDRYRACVLLRRWVRESVVSSTLFSETQNN